MNIKTLGAAALAAILTACSGTTGTVAPPTPAPTLVPAVQHLYVGDSVAGVIRTYVLPLTAASAPVAITTSPGVALLAANGANLAAADQTGKVTIFAQPFAASSTPVATFTPPGHGAMAFASSGALLMADGSNIDSYTPPFTNASAPASAQNVGLSSTLLSRGPDGTLYVSGAGNTFSAVTTAPPGVTTVGLASGVEVLGTAASATQLFVCSGTTTTDIGISVYNLPIVATSTPVATFTQGVNVAVSMAVDSTGDLYVANALQGTVSVYAPPFSSTSSPAITITTGGQDSGLAIAP